MRRTDFWIEDKKLDLFDDEQIKVISQVQSFQDISKVFSDYSQTFTVPATDNNNEIFEYYYNNDLDGLIDHNLRRKSRLDIDYEVFKTGLAQLEKGTIVNGMPQHYTATFYGDVVSLKDKIGEDMLSDLDYTTIDHAYTETEVFKRVKGQIVDSVKYPMITSLSNWNYAGGGANDITTSTGQVRHTDLFPAVTLSKLFALIQSKYSINFIGSWFLSPSFLKLCLWFKNKNQIQQISKPYNLVNDNDENFTNGFIFGELFYTYRNPSTLSGILGHNVSVQVNTSSTFDYYLDVYKNGIYLITLTKFGGGNNLFQVVTLQANYLSLSESYTFKIRSKGVATFTGSIKYSITYYDNTTSSILLEAHSNNFNSISTTITTDLRIYAPEMKILDFIKSVMQSAQLTVVGNSDTSFTFMPLDEFYNYGRNIDITKFVVTDLIEYKRPSLFSEINFSYQKSESVLNSNFLDTYGRSFGDLRSTFPYDGGKFDIQIGFENILQQKFTGTNLQVGYSLNKNLQPYLPKPVLLAQLDTVPGMYQVFLGNTAYTGNYVPFGQEIYNGTDISTINWNIEVSSYTNNPQSNGLYRTYYESFLLNLFNKKTRVVSLNANFPQSLLIDLKLSDKLIIKDKKYIINSMQTNLSTGDVKLELLSWFNADSVDRNIRVSPSAGTYVVGFEAGDGTRNISSDGLSFGSFSVSSGTGSFTSTFTYPENTTGTIRTQAVQVTSERKEGNETELIYSQLIITQEE